MLLKFRDAATRLVLQALQQNSANPAARFAGKRGSENANCNNISNVIKEYGNRRLYPNFPDLPNPRLNIPQPIRLYQTDVSSLPIQRKSQYMTTLSRIVPLSPRPPPKNGCGGNCGGRGPPSTTPLGKKRKPRTKPTPGPPPRCDPTPPRRMLTPRYTPKSVQAEMFALPPFSQLNKSVVDIDMIWPEMQKTNDIMPNLPNLPELVDMMTSSFKAQPRIRTDVQPRVEIGICTPYTLSQAPAQCYENYYYEELPRNRRTRTRRLKGC